MKRLPMRRSVCGASISPRTVRSSSSTERWSRAALPLETDGSVMHTLLTAAADIVGGASAVRAAPKGFISVTGSLFTRVLGRAYLPVRFETSVCSGFGAIQTVGVVAHGDTGTALTMSLTMVLIPADQQSG